MEEVEKVVNLEKWRRQVNGRSGEGRQCEEKVGKLEKWRRSVKCELRRR